MMFHSTGRNKLLQWQRKLVKEYSSYRQGLISEKEYLARAKPIDKAIGKLEMSTLQGTLAYKAASLQHSQKQEH